MGEPKKKGIGIMIELGKHKPDEPPPLGKGLLDDVPMPPPEDMMGEDEGTSQAFDDAAGEAFAAAKADDQAGFVAALRLAIEALI